jgi:hypothetical protein
MKVECVWWEELDNGNGWFAYNLSEDRGTNCYNVAENMIEPDGGEIIWDEERI